MAGYKLVFKGLKAFNKALDNYGKRTVPEAHLALQKKIAIDLFGKIIEKTPVGNPSLWAESSLPPPKGYVGGRARANWAISIVTPSNSLSANADPEEGVETNYPISGLQEAAGFAAMSKAKFGQTIWIYNNVRYIKRLEDGHSQKQAPAGMVAVSIAEMQAGLF